MGALINGMIETAQKLGGLSSSAILALCVMVLAYRDYQKSKDEQEQAIKRLQAWQDASKAEEHQTVAIEKVAEATTMTAQMQQRTAEEVKRLAILIEERIPRRN